MISIMMYEWSIFLTTPILTETNWRAGANTETQAAFTANSGEWESPVNYQIWTRSESLIMSDSLKNHRNVISESVNFFYINFQPSSSSDRLIISHRHRFPTQLCPCAASPQRIDSMTVWHGMAGASPADFWDRNLGVDPRWFRTGHRCGNS